MKKLFLIFFALCLGFSPVLQAQSKGFVISGAVTDAGTKEPLEMVLVSLPEYGLWATTNAKGEFSITKVPAGATTLKVDYLGYQTQEMKITISRNIENLLFKLKEDNLTLQEVTVTAKENKSAATTTRTMEKQAIEHLQLVNAADIMSLLPGGVTKKQDLTAESQINLRGDVTKGFGTAVVMDGIRLSTNSSLSISSSENALKGTSTFTTQIPYGVDTRSIAASNIESVEVITGVPSVEYGDMTAGMVIVNTKKGRTPYTAQVSLNPKTKQVAVSKGFELGKNRGVLNFNAEYASAFEKPISRYTKYFRNNYGVNYSNTFNDKGKPVQLNLSLSGGLAQKTRDDDPDLYRGTWEKYNNDNLRFGATVKWLINSSWITNLEFKGSASYVNDLAEANQYYSYSTKQPAINSLENGYFESNYLPAQFYNLKTIDSKGLDFSAGVKATLNKKIGKVNNNIKVGFTWTNSGNVGNGIYYADDLMPGGFRPRPYTDIPFMNNYAEYIEENVTIPIGKTTLSLIGGVRVETISVKETKYENLTSVSPRFNGKYTIISNKRKGFVRSFSIRGAWGQMEKLPSLAVLYPQDTYKDILVYNKTYGENNNVFAVGNTVVSSPVNPDLKLARSRNIEAGIEANLGGVGVSLVYFNNRIKNAYELIRSYRPYAYARTDASVKVPSNPGFRVDKNTGDIYVTDLDNASSSEMLLPKSVLDTTFIACNYQGNKNPYTTQGVELSVDFGQIKAIRTSFLLDANYTFKKDIDERLTPFYKGLSHSTLGATRSYEFIGYYVGAANGEGNQTYNGIETADLTANITAVTHIPEIRLTVSARLECALYTSEKKITYYNGQEWAYLVDNNGNSVDGSVYNQREYITGVWPVAYSTFDGVVRPFTEKEAGDPRFSHLIGSSNQTFTYMKDGVGAYFMANISVTKEIGKIASVSFYVNNFTNSNPKLKQWASGNYTTQTIEFTYGASLRLKF